MRLVQRTRVIFFHYLTGYLSLKELYMDISFDAKFEEKAGDCGVSMQLRRLLQSSLSSVRPYSGL